MTTPLQIKFLVSPGKRIALLALTFIVGSIVTAVASAVLMRAGSGEKFTAMMRMATVVQDLLMFILPAVATAVMVTRRPASLLGIDRLPRPSAWIAAALALVVSTPLMSEIIALNDAVSFPPGLQWLEQSLRDLEENATATVELMMGAHTIGNLVVNVLIIGVMTGLAEEMFFRGGLQRLIGSTAAGRHAAIWIAAIVFSALHMQFFGFVPRMLLGAFFGYLLVWTGSLWLPVAMHALNNSIYVVLSYATGSGEPPMDFMPRPAAVALSAAATAAALWWLASLSHNHNDNPQPTNP